MINIIAFKQLYKGQKIDKIRWIYDKIILANKMPKTLLNLLLKGLILINKAIIRLER